MSGSSRYLLAALFGLGLGAVLMWPRLKEPRQAEGLSASASAQSPAMTALPSAAPAPSASTSAVAVSSAKAAASSPAASATAKEARCPADMVFVQGFYCPFVAHRCEMYVGVPPKDPKEAQGARCQSYRDELLCDGRPSSLHYCIDRFEYPNLKGLLPAIMMSYREAARACAAEGKRLCEAEEWAFACEGARTQPYPYGIERDPGKCNIDRQAYRPNREAMSNPHDVSGEVHRLDGRIGSGVLEGCRSPFGVHDTTGNVAEWVHDRESKGKLGEAVIGGHFGRSEATCRSRMMVNGPEQRSHQTGFRCCADSLDGFPARTMLSPNARLTRRRPVTQ